MLTRLIVVGVDRYSSSQAVRWAIDRAVARGMALELVHALPGRPPGSAEQAENRLRSGRQLVDGEAERARRSGLCDVRVTVVDQPMYAALVTASERAELLVLGRRDRSAVLGRQTGSVSGYLSKYARCPVVVVPAVARPSHARRIVLMLNGEPSDPAATSFANDEATLSGAEIEVIHANRIQGAPEGALLSAAEHADLVVLPTRASIDDTSEASEPEVTGVRHVRCPIVYAR